MRTIEGESQQARRQLAELYQDTPGEHGIRAIRNLTDDEAEEIEAADRLIATAAGARPYHRCRDIYRIVVDRIVDLQTADPAGPGDVSLVRSAFSSLAEAMEELVDSLERTVDEFASACAQAEVGECASRVRDSPAWRRVVELGDAQAGSFMLTPDEEVVWQRQEDEELLDPAEAASAAVIAGQELLTRHYVALEPALTDAAIRLLSLAVETPGGMPGIVELDEKDGEPLRIKPRILALDQTAAALRAARMAKKVTTSDEDQSFRERPEAESDPDNGDGANSDSSSNQAEFGTEDDEDENGEERSEAPAPVEFGALFRLARHLDSDLEKAWSAALDEALVDPGVEKQLAAVGTLLGALQREIAAAEERLRKEGVDTRIKVWPLPDDELARLGVSQDSKPHSNQAQLAQIEAFSAVAETFDGLRQPANTTVTFDDTEATVEQFWSAGAFALLKDRLWLLERITREQPRRADDSGSSTDRAASALERIRLGTEAAMRGDPEAAVFHAVAAVAETLDVPLERIAERLAEGAPEGGPTFPEEQIAILVRAVELAKANLAGRGSLSASTLLARSALRAAHELTLGPIPEQDLSPAELTELIRSRQPLRSLEGDDDEAG